MPGRVMDPNESQVWWKTSGRAHPKVGDLVGLYGCRPIPIRREYTRTRHG